VSTGKWDGHERRAPVVVPDDQIERIAERAAEKAIEKLYTELGKNVVRKAMWILGALLVAATIWLAKHDVLKP
jgi:hypothetical protein